MHSTPTARHPGVGEASGSGRIYVDVRDAGAHKRYGIHHGIARYARELIPRLTVPWVAFDGPFRRATPLDAVNPHRLALGRSEVLYNPGFNAGLGRCAQLLTLHDLTHLRAPTSRMPWINRAFYDGVVKPAARRTGHVLTNSETSAEDIRDWFGDDRVVVHNTGIGCAPEFTVAGPVADPGRPYFLYVGNFKAHKNAEPAFAAMDAFPDHLLVTVVATADVPAAAALAQRCGIGERLVVRTAVSDAELAALYRGAAALVFPSIWEGVGLPVIEALRSGTKVVYCSAATAVAEVCEGGQFAVDDAGDPARFADRMAAALAAPFSTPSGLGRFDWDRVAGSVDAVIRQVQQENRGPAVR